MSKLAGLWLGAHDSLAFCMSTNTFNNPAFAETLLACAAESELPIRVVSHTPSIHQASNPSSQAAAAATDIEDEEEPEGERVGSLRSSWNSFCDNLGFSLRSKLFVAELSLKRKMGRLKRFWWRRRPSMRRVSSLVLAAGAGSAHQHKEEEQQQLGTWNANCTEQLLYWLEREPGDSKESLSEQKERILSRLEQVKRAASRERQREAGPLFNMEHNGARWSSPRAQVSPGAGSGGGGSREAGGAAKAPPAPPSRRKSSKWKQRPAKHNYWPRNAGQSSEAAHNHDSKRQGESGKEEAGKLCIICYTNQANIVTLPCKHHEICSDCFVELIYGAVKHSRFPLKCVLCRQRVERIRCSRRWLLSVIEKSRLLA